MYKAEKIAIKYVASSTVERQGNRHSIECYLKKGYLIKDSRNGYWLLVKPAKVFVTAYCGDDGIFTHDMKNSILEIYGRSRISIELIDTFKNDFNDGKLSVEADKHGFSIANN